jgi:hypothetical protein
MDEVHSRLLREVNTYLEFFQRRRVGTSFASSACACTDLARVFYRQEIEQDYIDALRKVCRHSLFVPAAPIDPCAVCSSR